MTAVLERPARTVAPPAMTLAALGDGLDALLADYADGYDTLLACLREQREALRRADGPGVDRAAKSQAKAVAALAGLESRRGPLVNAAAETLPSLRAARTTPITLSEVAGALPGADTLRSRAARLREQAAEAHTLSTSVAGATRSLMNHVEGLMRGVSQRVSHAGTYGPTGAVTAGGAVVSSLDLRT